MLKSKFPLNNYGEGGIRTHEQSPVKRFRVVRFRPLSHLSVIKNIYINLYIHSIYLIYVLYLKLQSQPAFFIILIAIELLLPRSSTVTLSGVKAPKFLTI